VKQKCEQCETCRYRSRQAPFCGFCIKKILEEQKEKKDHGNGQADNKDADETDR